MYAIFETCGRQYRVAPDETVVLDRLPHEVGEEVEFDRVALIEQDGRTQVGTPWVEGAKLKCRVLSHDKGRKVEVFTFKSKESKQRRMGHRQLHTRVKIEEIVVKGGKGD